MRHFCATRAVDRALRAQSILQLEPSPINRDLPSKQLHALTNSQMDRRINSMESMDSSLISMRFSTICAGCATFVLFRVDHAPQIGHHRANEMESVDQYQKITVQELNVGWKWIGPIAQSGRLTVQRAYHQRSNRQKDAPNRHQSRPRSRINLKPKPPRIDSTLPQSRRRICPASHSRWPLQFSAPNLLARPPPRPDRAAAAPVPPSATLSSQG